VTAFRPFSGIRVLELSGEDSGAAYTGALMAAFGAEVTRCDVGPAGGPPATGAARLHADKQLVSEPHAALARGWDVVLADGAWERAGDPHGLAEVDLAAAGAVLTWVTPYGRHGEPAPRASDFTLQADAGIVEVTGHADGDGVRAGFALGATMAACIATATTAAALAARERGQAHPREIDVAVFDALYSSLTTQLPARWLGDDGPPRAGNRHPMAAPWNTYLCDDGWISVCTMSDRQWRALCELIDRAEWVEDAELSTAGGRVARAAEIDAAIEQWTAPRSVEDALVAFRRVGVACGSIRSLQEARRCSGLPQEAAGVPAPGWFLAGAEPPPRRRGPATPTAAAAAPLSGLRILEVGAYTSGPVGTRLLAGLGATVTKVEPPHGDPCRRLASQIAGSAYLFHINNTDKRSVVLDSADPAAHAHAAELLAASDVFVSNLSERTLAELHLDADSVARDAPGLLHCVVTGFDRRSQDGGLLAFDTVVQAMCGMMAVTGNPDEAPVRVGVSAIDFLGGLMTATQIASWWLWRTRGGPDGALEIPLHDIGVWACCDSWDLGDAAVRTGNRHPDALVQDVFAVSDGAVAITVDRAGDGERLRAVIPAFAADEALAHEQLRAWCATRTLAQALGALAAAGVAAAQASGLDRVVAHPRARAREVLAVGEPASSVPRLLGYPWWLDGEPGAIGTLAPSSPGAGVGAPWAPAARARRTM
jgi:crotonobetainyl-CoA:carnitine CoA-transferase CaiB-like acyl-CoA transferase